MKGPLGILAIFLALPIAAAAIFVGVLGAAFAEVMFILALGLGSLAIGAWFIFSQFSDDQKLQETTESYGRSLRYKADLGDANSLYECARCFENGSNGFVREVSVAIDCYKRAASLGHEDAAKRLALMETDPSDNLRRRTAPPLSIPKWP